MAIQLDPQLTCNENPSNANVVDCVTVDQDRPERPSSAYFIFMEKFRQAYKEKHPNNRSVCVVGKAGGDRWKSMSDSEKAPYVAMEKQRKIEYLKYWEAHEKKAVSPWKNADEE
ncbi:high mobility group B protein 3-like [Papaver somniferum]|uniref:high mobility group B protein 3-like n=1 Tax=Papaver somniferum TaxID=3469 RepID=UPI000E704F8A|nr:high mobility group B protein 3-like [Papaver somniferum]